MTEPTPGPSVTPRPDAGAPGPARTGLDEAQSDALARALPAGMLLASRYDVKALLGVGGMGAVYHVRDRTREEDVALKVMLPSLLSRGDAKERFRREANIMLRLTHDGIVRVFDFGRDDALGLAFYTMELLLGRTLRGYLDSKRAPGALPDPCEALTIVGGILDTLRYAHGQKVVHRDLKPENIFLVGPPGAPADAPPGALKILDFGIAKVMDPSKLTKTGAEMGSYCYIAPEQQKDAGLVDQRADLYAVSAILYELLTGKQPVGKFKDPSKLRPELPKSADTLIENGLASEPEERTATAELLGAAVAALRREIEGLKAAVGVGSGVARKPSTPPIVEAPDAGATRGRQEAGVARAAEKEAAPPSPPGRVLRGHTERVMSVAITPDGRRGLSSGWDSVVRLWDLDSGAEIGRFRGHAGWIGSVAFLGDGRRAASAGADATVRVWDCESGRQLLELRKDLYTSSHLGASQDGRLIVSWGGDQTARIWDAGSGAHVRKLGGWFSSAHSKAVSSAALSRDGALVLTGSTGMDADIKLWEVSSGKLLHTFDEGFRYGINQVAFLPDGERAIAITGQAPHLLDLRAGRDLGRVSSDAAQWNSFAIAASGTRAAISENYNGCFVRVVDLPTGRAAHTFTGHSKDVTSIAVSSLGRRVLSGSDDWTVRVWDV